MIVWGSITGGTNSNSPVPSELVTWQNGVRQTLTSGSGDDRNPSWSPTGTVIGTW
jgi:Tol biopolymer transport system component